MTVNAIDAQREVKLCTLIGLGWPSLCRMRREIEEDVETGRERLLGGDWGIVYI